MSMEEFESFEQPAEQQQGGLDIGKFIKGFIKRKWIILSLAVLMAIPFYFRAKNQVLIYKCKVTIQSKNLEDKESAIFDGETQAEIKSETFTERMACVLGLAFYNSDSLHTLDEVFSEYTTTTNPVVSRYKIEIDNFGSYYLFQKFDDGTKAIIDSANVWEAIESPREVNGLSFRLQPAFAQMGGEYHFRIRPFEKGFKLLSFGVTKAFSRSGKFMVLELKGEDPDLIPEQLNRIADAYLTQIKKMKSVDSEDKREILRRKLQVAERNMKSSEEALRRFNQQYPLTLKVEKNSLADRLSELETALRDLPEQRQILRSLIAKLENPESGYESKSRSVIVHQLANLDILVREPQMAIYRQTLEDLEKQFSERYEETSGEHEDVIRLGNRITETQESIIEFASNFRSTLAEKEQQYRLDKTEIENRLRNMPGLEVRLAELEREYSLMEETYKARYADLNTYQVEEESTELGIQILDYAMRPTKPINPSKKSQVILGGVLGLVLGLFISIGIDLADRSIHTLKDVKKHLNLPVLGMIPIITFKDIPDFRDDQKALQIDKQLVTHDYSPTPVGEAYRALRTQLLFSHGAEQIRTLLITSVSPEEGKSFTAGNLAIIMAQQRTNTLLVDADLRRGVQHNTFSVRKEPGLTNFLSNNATLAGLIQPTHVPNLSVMSCGALIPNPSELLGSMQMRRFIAEVKRKYDFIIFDAPPLDAATDSVVISTLVDAVAVVVRAGKTNRNSAKERLGIFNTVPANLAGIIVNGTEEIPMKNSYSYYHY